MQEIQIASLLERARVLKTLIEGPLENKVLEVELNSQSYTNKELLLRLIRSLDQYVNKKDHLIYLGFLGHYSSGKSSTINNLFGLLNTDKERSVGLNPTDKAITLLTSSKNSNDLIFMTRESSIVPVRTDLLDQLEFPNVVIADTPGSGDPQVVNEMIQDFLPICDYILYFIPSTNPMDQADLPLLEQKTHRLSFIPLKFVITRTDEFRLDKTKPITSDNINIPKKDQFIGQLISRIKEIIKTDKLSLEDFIFIDNEYNYGLADLKSQIKKWSESIDSETAINIHSAKVLYYKSSFETILKYFISILNGKLERSKDFLKAANENIKRFDKSIELNNEKLKTLWARSDVTFRDALAEETRRLNEQKIKLNPHPIANGDLTSGERRYIKSSIDDIVKGYSGFLISEHNISLRSQIREVKKIIHHAISDGIILTGNISPFFPGVITLNSSSQNLDVDFSKLNEYLKGYQKKATEYVKDRRAFVRTKIITVKGVLSQQSLVSAITSLYQDGKKIISENFDQYFEKVNMYRSAVTSRNTKESIEKLRIGTQLDDLEDDFSDEYMTKNKQRANETVYFSNEQKIAAYMRDSEVIDRMLGEMRNTLDDLNLNPSVQLPALEREPVDVSTISNSLRNQAQIEVNKIYQKKLSSVLEQHDAHYQQYEINSRNLRKERKSRIFRWCGIVTVFAILTYLALRFSQIIKPNSLTLDVLITIATATFFNGLTYLYGILKLDIKRIVSSKKQEFIAQQRSFLHREFNEDFWDELVKKGIDIKDVQSSLLSTAVTQKMNSGLIAIDSAYQPILDHIQKMNDDVIAQIIQYQSISEVFYTQHSAIFKSVDDNISEIDSITKRIKQTAIKPSFDLIKETTDDLEVVKEKIEEIYK